MTIPLLRRLLWRFKWWQISRNNPHLNPSDWGISFIQWIEGRYKLEGFEVLTSDAMMWTLGRITAEIR